MHEVGSDAWRNWLAASNSSGFRFDAPSGQFTARRETRRNRSYWYAYRKSAGTLRKVYLGRTADLTATRLETAADALQVLSVPPADQPEVGRALPVDRTSFVGRAHDVAELARLLETERCLSLTGTGGIGKTRLAVRVARIVEPRFADGVRLAELGGLSEPDLVWSTLTDVLGLPESDAGPPFAWAGTRVAASHALLVLDHCEHLRAACAEVVGWLLASCPRLTILATSRDPLRVPGERVWETRPLSADSGTASDAVQLFVERARAVRPRFQLTTYNAAAVARICQQLDGLPLAIEMAAARLRTLTPRQLATRLDLPGPPRGAAPIRNAVDWSLVTLTDTLSGEEQQLLEQLSVFAGGFDGDAVAAVCVGLDARLLLERLVGRSLVATDGARYRLLETTREYAAARLRASRRTSAARARHVAWCLGLVEEAERYLRGPEQAVWLNRLEVEHDNIRVALRWTIAHRHADHAGRFGLALWRFWYVRGHYVEGRRWLEALLALRWSARFEAQRSVVLFGLGQLAFEQGDYAAARRVATRALEVGRRVGDLEAESAALTLLGNIARGEGDLEAAQRFYQSGLDIRTGTGRRRDIAISLGALGHVALARGEYARARDYYTRALAIERELGQHKDLATLLDRLGEAALEQAAYNEARHYFGEALRLARSVGDRQRIASVLHGFAGLADAELQPSRALTLAGAAASLRTTIRARLSDREAARLDARLASSRDAIGPDAAQWFDHGYQLGMAAAMSLALAPTPFSTSLVSSPGKVGDLTDRELQVASFVGRGLSNRVIAAELGVAISTVQRHVVNIMTKLGVRSRVQVALWWANRSV